MLGVLLLIIILLFFIIIFNVLFCLNSVFEGNNLILIGIILFCDNFNFVLCLC